MKKVSIIIPVYNQENFLGSAINSALKQTYSNLEIIIINDGSCDNSALVANDFLKNNPDKIKFFNFEKNQGVVTARNFGIENAEGEYILPLDGDDVIEPTYVEESVNILNNNPEIGIVYSCARLFGKKNKPWVLPLPVLDNILYSNCIFACALFRKNDFIKAGKYDKQFNEGYEDWDLWLSFFELGLKPYRIDKVLFNYRQHIKESRNDYAILKQKEINRKIFNKHINLYLQSTSFYEKIYPSYGVCLHKKIKKYKTLFNLFLLLSLIEFLLLKIAIWGI